MTCIPSGKTVLEPRDEDIQRLLSCKVHLGTKNVQKAMEKYVFARRKDGINVIDLHTTWQKLLLAARVIVTIENPQDVVVLSARPYGQRASLKFCQHTAATCMAGRFTPGTFTNHCTKKFVQPRLLIVTDPRTDHQPVLEASYANIPVIAFTDTDSPLSYVDIAIPCNNRGRQALGMLYWMLAREILRMRGTIARSVPWTEKVDLFFYRDPDEVMKKDSDKEPAAVVSESRGDKTYEKTVGGDSWAETDTWGAGDQWSAEA